MLFFIHCVFDPERLDQVQELRDSHLAYIDQQRAKITYGGLLQSTAGGLDGICYFLDANSREAARKFAATDPYGSLYSHITAQHFEQRIPAPDNLPTERKTAG